MNVPPRVHFVGIGGIGMSGLAKVLLEDGHEVSGSDRSASAIVGRLAAAGARVATGHAAVNLGNAELVVISSAVPADNPEVLAALDRGIPIVKRAELLGALLDARRGIAVAGTHGKTTTSAMVSLILLAAGLDPTMLVGGELRGLETNARRGAGEWLVTEADEYDRSFLQLRPEIAIITNVEADHLDIYESIQDIQATFQQFAGQVTGELIVCADDPFLATFANATTYGLNAGDWRATTIRPNGRGGLDFAVVQDGRPIADASLSVPGRHNVGNALGAIAVSYAAGVPVPVAVAALSTFGGVHRRQEIRGEAAGVTVVDDYGHHPTEVRVTLDALRERFAGRRIVCLFQPHTFSRTRLLMDEFATAFGDADSVWIAPIYAAREQNDWNVSSSEVVAAIGRHHSDVRELADLADIDDLVASLKRGDVLVTMGAGDVYRAGEAALAALSAPAG